MSTIENKTVQRMLELERIYGQGNQFARIPFMELPRLRNLSLNSNKITVIENVEHLVSLETFVLRGNQITRITGLEGLTKLRWLDVSENRLVKVDGMSSQSQSLEKLFLTGNKLSSFDDVKYIGETLKNAKFVFIDKNPLFEEGNEFFLKVKAHIKNIVRIA